MTVARCTAHPATAPSRGDTPGFIADHELAAGRRQLIAVLGLSIIAWLPSHVSAQHVHGVIDLGVVIEDQTLAVSIDAPLSDVVGFEHAPGNEDQAALLEKAAAILANADAMFGVPESADCNVTSTDVSAPEYLERLIAGEQGDEADHGDHHDHDHDDHDHDSHGNDHENHDHDHESHDHDHDSHDHDHDHSAEHAEVNATYQWTCRNPSELDAMALSFIDGFLSVETVQVQLLTSDGAQVINLTANDTSLPLAGR